MPPEIQHATPCAREIFAYLILHKNKGTHSITIKELQEELSWKKGYIRRTYSLSQIRTSIKYLCDLSLLQYSNNIMKLCGYVSKIHIPEQRNNSDRAHEQHHEAKHPMEIFRCMKIENPSAYMALVDKTAEKFSKEKAIVDREFDKFINYWTQKNVNGKKELWQMQKVFELKARMNTWFSNIRERTAPVSRGIPQF